MVSYDYELDGKTKSDDANCLLMKRIEDDA